MQASVNPVNPVNLVNLVHLSIRGSRFPFLYQIFVLLPHRILRQKHLPEMLLEQNQLARYALSCYTCIRH